MKLFLYFGKFFLARCIYSAYIEHMSSNSRPRGAVTKSKSDSKAILVYFPKHLIPLIDEAVRLTDSDRSKFIRNSVRGQLNNLQIVAAK